MSLPRLPKGGEFSGSLQKGCILGFFLKRDGILWVFGKGVKFSGFWQRGKILGVSGKGGGGGQFSVLFLKRRYSGYFL